MTASRTFVSRTVAAACVLLLGACAAPPVDPALQEENARIARSVAIEQHGDALAAAGDLDGALQDYRHALSLVALYYSGVYWLGGSAAMPPQPQFVPQGIVEYPKPGHAAYDAGIRDGDILTAVNGQSIAGVSTLTALWARMNENTLEPPTLSLLRDGVPYSVRMPYVEWMLAEPPFVADWLPREWGLVDKQVALYARGARRPPVSETARRLGARAQAAARDSRTPQQVEEAADLFVLAEFVAPYWPDLDIDAAIFQKAAGDAADATRSLEHYLALAPNGSDAPAARAMLVQLEPAAAQDLRNSEWAGFWPQVVGGAVQSTGLTLDRHGSLLTATIAGKPKPFLRATILDDNNAKAYLVFSNESGDLSAFPSRLAKAIVNCFGGTMETATTLTLSPDRHTLTLVQYDLDIDAGNCAITRNVPSTLTYRR